MKRILHVIDSLSIGGAEKLLVDLTHLSLRRGHDVTVAYFTEGPLEADLRRLGLEPTQISRHGLKDPMALLRLMRLMRRFRPDVVHTHLSKSDILGQIAAAVCGVTVRISTIHNVDPWRASPIWSRVMRIATSGAHRFIAVSEQVERYVRRWGGCRPDRLVTIPNGIDVERFRLPGEVASEEPGTSAVVIGAVGRLTPAKNHTMLIDAVAALHHMHPGVQLVIYGVGPLEDHLVNRIAEAGLADIARIAGTSDDMPATMSSLDILAFPSQFEGLPLALLEGMAMELAIVATKSGGITDVIDDHVDGLLVDRGDLTAFTDALDRLIANRALRRSLGLAAREKVESAYTSDMNAEAVLALYDELGLGSETADRSPLRVLSVTKSTGGLAFYNTRLVQLLVQRGLEVDVVCLSEGGESYAEQLRESGVGATAMGMSRYRIDPFGDTKVAAALIRHIRAGRYDVLIGHGSKAGFLVRLAGRMTNVPAIYALASLSFVSRTQGRSALIYRQLERLGRILGGFVVTVSESTRMEMLRRRLARSDRVTAIQTGIAVDPSERIDGQVAKDRLGFEPHSIVVGWAARMVPQKAPEVFVQMVAELDDAELVAPKLFDQGNVRFVMAGDGPLIDLVHTEARRLGVTDRLTLIPWQEDIATLYSAFDVFVLTSRWEGLPQSLLEAMAFGAVPVSTDVDGNSEVIIDGVSGFLTPAGRPAAMADRVHQLVTSHDLREEMAMAAQERVETHFTTDRMIDGWMSVLSRAAQRRPPGAGIAEASNG